MKKFPIKALHIILLSIILLAAFLLNIKQVFPFTSVDEDWISGLLWKFYENPFPISFYPPFFLYLNFILSLLFKSIFLLLGIVSTSSRFIATIGLPFTLLAGRILNAVLSVLLVFTVFRIGKQFFTETVSFFASLIMAFSSLLILHAHIFKAEVLLTLLTTVSFYFLFRYLENRKIYSLGLASFFYGLAVATKYNIIIFILVIILAALLPLRKLDKKKKIRLFFLVPAFSAAGFLAGAPNWLIHPLGNLKQALTSYGFGSSAVVEAYRYYNPLQMYGKFVSTFVHDFGMVFFILFLVSVVITIWTRSRKELLLTAYILLYIFMFGFMGFYGDRFCLPLYPSMALLVGKTLFIDLKKPFGQRQKAWTCVLIFIWSATAVFSLSSIQINLKTFNQLQTQSKRQWAQDYRMHHHIDPARFHIAFQQNTPRIHGQIKLNPSFERVRIRRNKNKIPLFIQADLTYYREYQKRPPGKTRSQGLGLDQYQPFYRIQKQKFQPWDYDYIFLYRISPELLKSKPEQPPQPVHFPRSFYESRHTSFFPLQVYERDPGFGKIKNGEGYLQYIYSRKKIEKLVFHFFTPDQPFPLDLKINNRSQVVRIKKNRLVVAELGDIPPRNFFHDCVYRIEMNAREKEQSVYFVYHLTYPEDSARDGSLPKYPLKMNEAEMPELFSSEKYPDWAKDFYRKTGIDLPLLKFVNQNPIFINTENTMADISPDYFPLQKGFYRLKTTGGKITDSYPIGKGAILNYTLFSDQKPVNQIISLQGKSQFSLDLEVTEPVAFIKLEFFKLPENNFVIKNIEINVNYTKSVQKSGPQKSDSNKEKMRIAG